MIVVGFMLRSGHLGVTSVIRDLSLSDRCYETLLHFLPFFRLVSALFTADVALGRSTVCASAGDSGSCRPYRRRDERGQGRARMPLVTKANSNVMAYELPSTKKPGDRKSVV